ncbi:MAG: hypothetical protein ACE5GK_02010 [Nitrospiria bacterium]
MTKRVCDGLFAFAATVIFTCLYSPCLSQSAELRPFKVPEQRQQADVPKREQKVDESVYIRFEAQVRKLSPDKKTTWIKNFNQKRDRAMDQEKWNEVKHYNRLLDILND